VGERRIATLDAGADLYWVVQANQRRGEAEE